MTESNFAAASMTPPTHLLNDRSVLRLHDRVTLRNRPEGGTVLESYAAGRWYRATDEGEPLLDAATGEEVARISSRGLDTAAMVRHARETGGPAVKKLTFHQRA